MMKMKFVLKIKIIKLLQQDSQGMVKVTIVGPHNRNRSAHNQWPGNGKLILRRCSSYTAVNLAKQCYTKSLAV